MSKNKPCHGLTMSGRGVSLQERVVTPEGFIDFWALKNTAVAPHWTVYLSLSGLLYRDYDRRPQDG